jgi:hypothetical protein
MTKRTLAALLLTAAAGCGGSEPSLCDNFGSTANNVLSKAQPCFQGQTPSVSLPTSAECNAAVARCSDTDKKALQTFLDCLNALPTCSSPTSPAWTNQLDACEATAHAGITTACADATGV